MVRSEKSWEKTAQRLLRKLKGIPMTRKVVVLDILIIHAGSVLYVKRKSCVELVVRIHPHINAVYVLNAYSTARIL